MNVIVYGPQGCGKSLNRGALLEHFAGLDAIQDGWDGASPVYPGALVLTNVPPGEFEVPDGARVVAFEDLARTLGLYGACTTCGKERRRRPYATSSDLCRCRASAPISIASRTMSEGDALGNREAQIAAAVFSLSYVATVASISAFLLAALPWRMSVLSSSSRCSNGSLFPMAGLGGGDRE